ncbi:MAG: PqqD family protein [Lachnospiraceae bacterium]
MKLKKGFVLHDIGKQHIMVASGEVAGLLNGMVYNNETANFIYHQLMQDTTEEKILEAMCQKYDAPKNVMKADLHRIIEQARQEGFLDE